MHLLLSQLHKIGESQGESPVLTFWVASGPVVSIIVDNKEKAREVGEKLLALAGDDEKPADFVDAPKKFINTLNRINYQLAIMARAMKRMRATVKADGRRTKK